jgi:hypothetical protein
MLQDSWDEEEEEENGPTEHTEYTESLPAVCRLMDDDFKEGSSGAKGWDASVLSAYSVGAPRG